MSRLPVLEKFIGDLRAIWTAQSDNQCRMERAKPLLEHLLCDPGLKAHSAGWPSTEGYKNLLLYVDPDHHFVINAVVRAPGRIALLAGSLEQAANHAEREPRTAIHSAVAGLDQVGLAEHTRRGNFDTQCDVSSAIRSRGFPVVLLWAGVLWLAGSIVLAIVAAIRVDRGTR